MAVLLQIAPFLTDSVVAQKHNGMHTPIFSLIYVRMEETQEWTVLDSINIW